MIRKVTAGQYIVNWMEHMEIDRFFFVPGESFLHVLDALLIVKKFRQLLQDMNLLLPMQRKHMENLQENQLFVWQQGVQVQVT